LKKWGASFATHNNAVPERMPDFRRFVSEEVNQILFKGINKVNVNVI